MANLDLKISNDLEIVCDDADYSLWKYDKSNNHYYRIYPDNTYTMINGDYLPDPEGLLNNRIKLHQKKGQRVNIEALKPSPAIYALWKHQQGVKNG